MEIEGYDIQLRKSKNNSVKVPKEVYEYLEANMGPPKDLILELPIIGRKIIIPRDGRPVEVIPYGVKEKNND